MQPAPAPVSSAFYEGDTSISGWAELRPELGKAQPFGASPAHTAGVLGLLGWQEPEFRAAITTGLAYALLAALALWVSAPEVYTGLWLPAAGLALAATFRRGIAALLGVAVAAFAVQALWADWRGLGPDMSVALPLCLAAAATVQAGLGAGLVQRLLAPGQPSATHLRDMLLAALLAGPVACLLGASIASLALWNFGVVQTASLWTTVFSIWLGNTLSVWLVAPLVLHSWPRRPPPQAPADTAQPRSTQPSSTRSSLMLTGPLSLLVLPVTLAVTLAMTLALALAVLGLQQWDRQQQQEQLQSHSLSLAEELSRQLQPPWFALQAMAATVTTAGPAAVLTEAASSRGVGKSRTLNGTLLPSHTAQGLVSAGLLWTGRAEADPAMPITTAAGAAKWQWPPHEAAEAPATQASMFDRRLLDLLQQAPAPASEAATTRLWRGAVLAGLSESDDGLISLVKPIWRARHPESVAARPVAPPDGVLWLTVKAAPLQALAAGWRWCLRADGAGGNAPDARQTQLAGSADCDRKDVFDNRKTPAEARTLRAWAAAESPPTHTQLLRPWTPLQAPLWLELRPAPQQQPLLHSTGRRAAALSAALLCALVAALWWALQVHGRLRAPGATVDDGAHPAEGLPTAQAGPSPVAVPTAALTPREPLGRDCWMATPAGALPSSSVIDLLPWGLLWLDRQGWLLSCNPLLCRRLGLHEELLVGSQLNTWLNIEGAGQLRRWYADHRRHKKAAADWQTTTAILPSGQHISFVWQARALYDRRGRVQGFAALLELQVPTAGQCKAPAAPVSALDTTDPDQSATAAQMSSPSPSPSLSHEAAVSRHISSAEPTAGPTSHRLLVHSIGNHPALQKYLAGVPGLRPDWQLSLSSLGLDGLAAVRMRRPDLLLLDMRLPDIDGLELLRHIKQDPTLVDLPLVVFTHDHHPDAIGHALELGANQCVSPPLDSAGFVDLVEQTLQAESVV